MSLVVLALALTAVRLSGQLSPTLWWKALVAPDLDDPLQLVFHFSALPRLATAILAGAGLGLAGAIFQQVLRNPLASPTTLGTEAGAQLALTVAVIGAPSLLGGGRELVTLAGAAGATAAVFACAFARGLSSLSVILAGLVVGLFCASASAALKLVEGEYASVLFLWGGGSLVQGDWSAPVFLAPRLLALAVLCAALLRPLSVLSLDDAGAGSLGLSVRSVRAAGVVLGTLLTSTITASVGVIGFVGLAAPQIARLAGARRFPDRLALAPLVGAAIVVAVDAAVGDLAERSVFRLPTGAATALLGAPLLIWLLPRLRPAAAPSGLLGLEPAGGSLGLRHLLGLAALVAAAIAVAILVGRTADGWALADASDLAVLAPWRLPRTVVAFGAGVMLATAGIVLQRLTGNPMASPEILGIGTGVAAGLALALLLVPALGEPTRFAASAVGALGALGILLAVGSRSRFAPEHLLLTGIALSALLDAFVVAFLALGNARALQLLGFVSGSTYRAGAASATVTMGLAAIFVPTTLALRRWLDILPIGEAGVRSLGVPLGPVRLALMALAALLTSAAILVAGPLSFVGLLGPHAARLAGARGVVRQVIAASLIGGGVMVAADWVGRVAIYPRQIPAGLMAALVAMPYLLWQLARRRG